MRTWQRVTGLRLFCNNSQMLEPQLRLVRCASVFMLCACLQVSMADQFCTLDALQRLCGKKGNDWWRGHMIRVWVTHDKTAQLPTDSHNYTHAFNPIKIVEMDMIPINTNIQLGAGFQTLKPDWTSIPAKFQILWLCLVQLHLSDYVVNNIACAVMQVRHIPDLCADRAKGTEVKLTQKSRILLNSTLAELTTNSGQELLGLYKRA